MTEQTITGINVYCTRDTNLPAYDNTRLQAINVCPTWGILRYQMHKSNSPASRSMALEAGSVSHECYSAIRLHQLMQYQNLPALADYHGKRLFGADRWHSIMHDASKHKDDVRDFGIHMMLGTLDTSSFYDDPEDKRRTLTNIENALTAYFDKQNFANNPVWVRNPTDETSDVGIEIAFDLTVDLAMSDGSTRLNRFVGRIDGIHLRNGTEVILEENKTASRLNDAWMDSFHTSSQVTGYIVAASTFVGQQIRRAAIRGMSIPLPKSYDYGGIVEQVVWRDPFMLRKWFEWFDHSVAMYERWQNDPINAPMYTHSCNRYFSSCAFVPFCTIAPEDKVGYIEEMYTDEWNPLHE